VWFMAMEKRPSMKARTDPIPAHNSLDGIAGLVV
jgi:hypothetical protein